MADFMGLDVSAFRERLKLEDSFQSLMAFGPLDDLWSGRLRRKDDDSGEHASQSPLPGGR